MTMRDSIAAAKLEGPEANADGHQAFRFQFSAADPTFAGHFPGMPLLPGVYQLEMTRMAAEWAFGGTFAIQEISRAKFQRPFLPDEPVKLELRCTEADGMIRARANFFIGGQPAGETNLLLCRNPA